jgi:hypothetical protein
MNRPIFVFAMIVAAAATLAAQDQQQQPNPYSGTSNPPPDSTIQDSQPPAPTPPPKPSPAQYPQQAAPAQPPQAVPAQTPPPANSYAPANGAQGTDSGTVQVAPGNGQPMLNQRTAIDDPDGDIVHPAPPPPGTLGYGTTIRVRLLDRLSTTESREGEPFHTRVTSDVYQNDQVLIPAGSEIDGRVMQVSAGHLGGHGSMVLHPETVILPNGTQLRMYAQLSETPDSNTRVGGEGTVAPGSRMKRDGIEYGGATGAGVITGAVVGGPAGALVGGLIGAGAVTVHLLVNHPQAKLDEGSTLVFSLTEPLDLVSAMQPQPQPQTQSQPQAQPQTQDQDQPGDQPAPAPAAQPAQNQ